jgi:hypothetical protein
VTVEGFDCCILVQLLPNCQQNPQALRLPPFSPDQAGIFTIAGSGGRSIVCPQAIFVQCPRPGSGISSFRQTLARPTRRCRILSRVYERKLPDSFVQLLDDLAELGIKRGNEFRKRFEFGILFARGSDDSNAEARIFLQIRSACSLPRDGRCPTSSQTWRISLTGT